MNFDDLYFGRASAENEVAADPSAFLQTYLDRWDLPRQIESQGKFLILGPKGSGKSAAAHYLALRWKRDFGESSVFHRAVDFDELNRSQTPLTDLDNQLVSNQLTAITDAAWKLFIGIRMLESLASDNACSLNREPKTLAILHQLKEAGLASDDYPKVLRRIRTRRASLSIPAITAETSSREAETLSPGQLGDAIINHALGAVTPNRHVLSIDGLDKAVGENRAYWATLAALVRVGDALRRRFQSERVRHLYLLIMCRTDVFRRARFADSAKISSDSGIHMDWGAEAQNPVDVLLWDYVAHKAGVRKADLFEALPKFVSVGSGGVETLRYMLDFTRYTPRDMSLLFNSIKDKLQNGGALTGDTVRAAADHFASSYLLIEIISEATGLLSGKVIDRLNQIIGQLPARTFRREELVNSIREAGLVEEISTDELGEYLFLQGVIGNYRPTTGYVQFYHRRDTNAFHRSGPWIVHTGLAYALNIPFSRSGRRRYGQ